MPLSQILIPIALCGGPSLAFVIQLRAYLRDRKLRKFGTKTEATLLHRDYIHEQLEGQEYLDTSKTRRVVTIQFMVHNQTLYFEEDIGNVTDKLSIGDKAPLWYNPEDPSKHVFFYGTTLKSLFGVFFLGLPMFLMGLWVAL